MDTNNGGSERGPSWVDVSTYVDDMQARWGFRPTLTLAPPFQNPRTLQWNAWGVCAAKPPAPGRPTSGKAVHAYWGRGGAHKTAPGAAYAALLELDAALERDASAAARQAKF